MKLKDSCSLKENLWQTSTAETSLCWQSSTESSLLCSSSYIWMWELDDKEGLALKNWCFQIVVLVKTLVSPLDSKEIKLPSLLSLQSCLTLCDPIDGSPPGSPVPGLLQARTLEWVAISLSNAWKWRVKGKSPSRVRLLATPWTAAHLAPPSWDFSGKGTGVGCHCLLRYF